MTGFNNETCDKIILAFSLMVLWLFGLVGWLIDCCERLFVGGRVKGRRRDGGGKAEGINVCISKTRIEIFSSRYR